MLSNSAFQTVFASYVERAVHFMELPGEVPNRQEPFTFQADHAIFR